MHITGDRSVTRIRYIMGEQIGDLNLQHDDGRIRVWRHRDERLLDPCVMYRPTGSAPGIMVWGGIGFHCRTTLVRIAGIVNSQRYISEVLEPVVFPHIQRLSSAIFQQDNA
ncbi:transposable element Tcb1 transposase [Trichonephila clavipes]|nr:transposable element Tcb1 transposase [Trichonephila clavipes]